jgi:hypothetical protein
VDAQYMPYERTRSIESVEGRQNQHGSSRQEDAPAEEFGIDPQRTQQYTFPLRFEPKRRSAY